MNNSVILTLSGGLDSATVLALAAKQQKEINVITVNYGQKNWEKELQNVKKLCEFYNVKELKIIDNTWLGEMGGSAITDENILLKSIDDDKIYVPFRNTLILSACVAWAETIDCNLIYTGSIDGNSEDICPDNTPKYYKLFNDLVREATKKNIKIIAPLLDFNKKEVLTIAVELGVPLEHTWSCVTSNLYPCGKCFSCSDRKNAFDSLGMNDPNYKVDKVKKYESK
ncbi:MAG: 7-cyano-7-deazaguanine synthase [Bacilli bacterium]|nr:7-cyano-7-deazaguanine synthase [Bacilli bacterium]